MQLRKSYCFITFSSILLPVQAVAIILWLLLKAASFSMACQRSAIAWIFLFASSSSLKYAVVHWSYSTRSYSMYIFSTFCARPSTVAFQCPELFL